MRHANPAGVAPPVLQWALDRAPATTTDLAAAAGTSEAVVDQWLEGRRSPSFRQARALATRLRIPFGFLFLPHPPPEELPIPDFRTVAGQPIRTLSVDIRDVVLATMRKQSWLSEYLKDAGREVVEVVGRARGESSSSAIAADIRRSLGFTSADRRPARPDDLLRELIRRVERLGVSVLRSGIVGNNTHRPLSVDEFRGFCLSDDYAPFIFLNSVDAPQAQVFTLIHELAHIWRGDSGISGAIGLASQSAETLCNKVSADVLVPSTEFGQIWDNDLPIRDAILVAARHFRVSRYVIAIRAFESGFVPQDMLNELLHEYRSEGTRRRTTDGGGDYYKTLISRNGRMFTQGVVEAVGRQHVLIRDAAGLLDAKSGQLPRIAQELRGAV